MEHIHVSVVSPGLETSQVYSEILDAVPDIRVMAMPGDLSGQGAWRAIANSDVVIIDEAIIEKEGYMALEMLLECYPGVRCLVVMRDFRQDKVVRAMLQGMRGVICGDESRHLLIRAVRQLYAGEVWIPRGFLEPVRQAFLSDSGRIQTQRRLDKPDEWHKYH